MKKLFSIVLCLLLTESLLSNAVLAASFPDVDENAPYVEAVQYLRDAGIMQGDDKGNFNPNKIVTRAEMAKIICTMLGETAELPSSDVYTDVPVKHWANPYIVKASELGIVCGYGNGRFEPSAPVAYEQAVTMLIRAIGLEEKANQLGQYPNGYIAVAENLGFTSGARVSQGDCLCRADTAVIVFNCQEARRLFDDTYWHYSMGFTNGGQHALVFHLDMTYSTVRYGPGYHGTFEYHDGVLTLNDSVPSESADFVKKGDRFESVETFLSQDYPIKRTISPSNREQYQLWSQEI